MALSDGDRANVWPNNGAGRVCTGQATLPLFHLRTLQCVLLYRPSHSAGPPDRNERFCRCGRSSSVSINIPMLQNVSPIDRSMIMVFCVWFCSISRPLTVRRNRDEWIVGDRESHQMVLDILRWTPQPDTVVLYYWNSRHRVAYAQRHWRNDCTCRGEWECAANDHHDHLSAKCERKDSKPMRNRFVNVWVGDRWEFTKKHMVWLVNEINMSRGDSH